MLSANVVADRAWDAKQALALLVTTWPTRCIWDPVVIFALERCVVRVSALYCTKVGRSSKAFLRRAIFTLYSQLLRQNFYKNYQLSEVTLDALQVSWNGEAWRDFCSLSAAPTCVLQDRYRTLSPMQYFPPCSGAGLSQPREEELMPVPQVREHSAQALHVPQEPSTACGR